MFPWPSSAVKLCPRSRRIRITWGRTILRSWTGAATWYPRGPSSEEQLAQLSSGVLSIRQRPGPKNSLGLVKFVFPNEHNVYLHSTPAPELFSRTRRDFSHGCIRAEDPVALAEWVLQGERGLDQRQDRGGDEQRPGFTASESGAENPGGDHLRHGGRIAGWGGEILPGYLRARCSPGEGSGQGVSAFPGKYGYQRRTRPTSTCTKLEAE